MGQLIKFITLVTLGHMKVIGINGNRLENDLGILRKDRLVEISQNTVEERVTLVANLNVSVTVLKPSFVLLANAYKKFTEMTILKDAALKAEYSKAIDTGRGHFQKVQEIMQDLYNNLDQSLAQNPESSCVYYMDVLNGSTVTEQTSFLSKKIAKLNSAWAVTDLKGESLSDFERFIQSYNSIAMDWYNTAERQAGHWNTLVSGKFPEGLIAPLEQIDCLEKSKYEQVKVITCTEGRQGLVCELNVIIPSSIKEFNILVAVNYQGAQIVTPHKNFRFAQSPESSDVVYIECSQEQADHTNVELCKEHAVPKDCAYAIKLADNDKIISHCNFTIYEPKVANHLYDNGVLVQGKDVIILENGRVLYYATPVLIYTNYDLLIQQNKKETRIIANTQTQNPHIVKTSLTQVQIDLMVAKAQWSDLLSALGWDDYLEYVSLLLEIILVPLTLLGIALGLKGKCTKRKKVPRTIESARRQNFREARAMLR
jgi:hypothetical protein